MATTKASRSKYWFVRIDGPKDFLLEKCKQLSSEIDVQSMLAAYHVGDSKENPHCHFVIELRSEPQKQSFAVRVKKLFNVEKRSQYSLNIWDGKRGAGACSYLFHEESVEILCNVGFTEGELAEARAANEITQRVVAVNKEKASNKFVDKAMSHFDSCPSEYDAFEYMVQLCRDGDLYWPGTFRAKQMIEEVRIKMSENVKEITWELYQKIFSR